MNMNHEITSLFIFIQNINRLWVHRRYQCAGRYCKKMVFRHLTVSEQMVELLCDLKGPWSTDGSDNNQDKNDFTCCEYYSFER